MNKSQEASNHLRIHAELSPEERRQLKAVAALMKRPLKVVVADACREFVLRANPTMTIQPGGTT
jgi:hypothetical protein